MKFTKMQGCGNDYVYVDAFTETVTNPSALARIIADRHYGVGGDGLILIEPSDRADAFMHMFNLDGSEGSMCGNGIRCCAKYIYDHGLIPPERRTAVIDTPSGLRETSLTVENGRVVSVTVDMGAPHLMSDLPEAIEVNGMELSFIGIDMGNPHAVYFLEDNPALGADSVNDLPLSEIGPVFETHPRFPDRVNSEFIRIINYGEIDFRVWERGSGETLACGTGASAAVVAGVLAGKLNQSVLVHLAGGDLRIDYDPDTGRCLMTGPAVEVFTGSWPD